MSISKDDLKHIAHLARLQFSDEEYEQLEKECDAILDFFNKLKNVDTERVEPLAHVGGEENMLRKDDSPSPFDTLSIIKAAPETKEGFIKVPPIFDI